MSATRKNFLYQLLLNTSQFLFPLITYPYITRVLGAEGIGKVAYIEYAVNIIITLAAIGIPIYGIREIARVRTSENLRHIIFRQLTFLHSLTAFVGVLIFLIYIFVDNRETDVSLIILGCFTIFLSAFNAEWYMQGMEAFKFISIRNILLRFGGLLAILFLVKNKQDYIIYFLITVLTQLSITITNLSKIGFRNLGTDQLAETKKHLPSLIHFFLTSSLIGIYLYLDVVILGWYADAVAIGYYATAIKVVKISLLLILSFNTILLPKMASVLANRDYATVKELVDKALQFIILTSIPICISMLILANEIVQIIAGKGFEGSILLIQILATLPFIIGLSNVFGYQILASLNQEKKLLISVGLGSIVSIILNIILAKTLQEKGCAIATLLTELSVTCITGYYAHKALGYSFPQKVLLQSLIAAMPLVGLTFWIKSVNNEPFFILVVSCSLGLVIYTSLQLILFRNRILVNSWQRIREKLPSYKGTIS